MSDRVQTSLWLKKDIKHLIDNENLNLSQWVNDTLEKLFSLSTGEDLDKKISELRTSLVLLESKKADLLLKGASDSMDNRVKNDVLKELQEIYRLRGHDDTTKDQDRFWITSPKNLIRLKTLGWSVEEGLLRLREWYDGLQKDNDA